jgi:hypothetical protein
LGAAAGVIIGGAILVRFFYTGKRAAVMLFSPEANTPIGTNCGCPLYVDRTNSTLAYFQFGGIRRPGKPVDRPKATKIPRPVWVNSSLPSRWRLVRPEFLGDYGCAG